MTFLTGSLHEPLSGRGWSAADVREQVGRRRSGLAERGVSPGDRVFLHHGNTLEFFADLLATWSTGACAVPVDRRSTPFEVVNLTRSAAPKLHVIDDATDAAVVEELDAKSVTATRDLLSKGGSGPPTGPWPRLDDDALILFTSGSTGDPKGVLHTHRSLDARWSALRDAMALDAFERTLCLLPTHFGHGLICNALFPWLHGRHLHVTPPFQASLVMRLGQLVDEHDITFLSSVPSVWRLALKVAKPPSGETLRRVHVGSAPLTGSLWGSVRDWAGTRDVVNAYGITETGSWVAGASGAEEDLVDGLVGRPWGARVRVSRSARVEDDIEECEPGETGLVWLGTPALMKGYFGRDDLTDAVVRGGWFSTGDVGLLDERGRLVLKGRERDEINKGGAKIHPADIDGVVERFGGVSDTCAFAFPDEHYGENVGLAVVLDGGDDALAGLHGWMERHLPRHAMPVRWHRLDEIPRTSRGKVNRARVAEVCGELSPVDLPAILARGDADE